MATVLLFHHALGQTPGFHAFAEELRAAGHTLHTPDLFEGRTFASIEEGMAHVESIGFPEILRRGAAMAEGLPADMVYAGFSLGVVPAQALAQARAGARGAILCYSCVPPAMLGGPWPADLSAEIHIMEDDALAAEDLGAARDLASAHREVELFLYPGTGHYFADSSFGHYDAAAAGLLMERTLKFLARVG